MAESLMKALVYHGPKNFEVISVPIPVCNEDEILIRVKFAGVCGTDNRIYQGTN